MRRLLCISMLVLLAAGASSRTSAQMGAPYGGDEISKKYALYVGVYLPAGSTLRDQGASLWKGFGLAANLQLDDAGRPGACISLEYVGDKNDNFAGSRIGLMYIKLFHKPLKGEQIRGLYYGLGLGVNLSHETVNDQLFVVPPVFAEDHSGIQPSITLIGGYDITEHFFIEVRYTAMTELAPGADFSTLGLTVGTRSLF